MKLLGIINPEDVSEGEAATYTLREASRAIAIDKDNNLAILHVQKARYYKLPGGGIEEGESREEALFRECLEEIGSTVTIITELGKVIEYRKIFSIKQISYCYLVLQIGEKGIPHFTNEELKNAFEPLWLPYTEAYTLVSTNNTTDIEVGSYIIPRDTLLLKKAGSFF